ncbi:hypothetical protein Pdw03_3364 [Penicillium digitatum]|uniref:Uncharacterized protein n=1 Tax=Penicillium digitatum TaxID=36651 RepID=A0A7T6XG46_PENDI|nr:hypothetical protein Pdw03_3364 [Penicillium digitatum]
MLIPARNKYYTTSDKAKREDEDDSTQIKEKKQEKKSGHNCSTPLRDNPIHSLAPVELGDSCTFGMDRMTGSAGRQSSSSSLPWRQHHTKVTVYRVGIPCP